MKKNELSDVLVKIEGCVRRGRAPFTYWHYEKDGEVLIRIEKGYEMLMLKATGLGYKHGVKDRRKTYRKATEEWLRENLEDMAVEVKAKKVQQKEWIDEQREIREKMKKRLKGMGFEDVYCGGRYCSVSLGAMDIRMSIDGDKLMLEQIGFRRDGQDAADLSVDEVMFEVLDRLGEVIDDREMIDK